MNQYPDENMSWNESMIPFKSCNLDPVPSRILRECLRLLLPVLTTIVNLPLESAMLSTPLKEALLLLFLKKCSLDADLHAIQQMQYNTMRYDTIRDTIRLVSFNAVFCS